MGHSTKQSYYYFSTSLLTNSESYCFFLTSPIPDLTMLAFNFFSLTFYMLYSQIGLVLLNGKNGSYVV